MKLDNGRREIAMINKIIRFFNPRWTLIKSELKREGGGGRFVEKNDAGYSVRIINRGEQLIYSGENGSVNVEISIFGKWLDVNSIRKWNEGKNVTEEQKSIVPSRVVEYFRNFQNLEISEINSTKG